jgi:hypothetical protein
LKLLDTILVTPNLLNELSTLAAPSMLEVALHAALGELGHVYSGKLFRYNAEFREGAREGDRVQPAIEETVAASAADREFKVYFSKSDRLGRVGSWHLIFTTQPESRLLSYSLSQVEADGRTDHELWRPEPMVATGNMVTDAQSLLWLAGQSARAYMKRLDQELAASGAELKSRDDIQSRSYGGISVTASLGRWPQREWTVRCGLHYQLPLAKQPRADKKMVFQGVWITEKADESYLLGTFRFTVVRLNGQRLSIYPDGSTERR